MGWRSSLHYLPTLEPLENRTAPALLASQFAPLTVPAVSTPVLDPSDVQTILDRAAAATANDDAIIAVVDRGGNILGVRVEGGVSSAITSDISNLVFSVDGAVSLARTGAFFSSDAGPLTSRTVEFVSQSTITEREVDSSPDETDQNSPLFGPGYVAPIGTGGHFPPGIANTPPVDLFGIEQTNRDASTVTLPDGSVETLPSRFNVPTQYIPAGQGESPPNSYGYVSGLLPTAQSRGIGTLPGGIPIYKDGELVGGIGVFFPGTTGYATEENSALSAGYDPSQPDLSEEAEFIAFAAIGGSSQAGVTVGALAGIAPVPGIDLPFGRIDLNGITLDEVGPGGLEGPQNLLRASPSYGVGQGNPNSGTNMPVDLAGDTLLTGVPVPVGWLVTPHDGVGITAAQVTQMIDQGIATASETRSQLRLPLGTTSQMVFAVTDSTGAVLGLYRMPDAPFFSIGVSVAKARNTAYYDDPDQLQSADEVPGLPAGASLTARTFRELAQPTFPEGVNGNAPGPFSILNDPGINPTTGMDVGPALPASAYTSVYGFTSFHANANFHAQTDPANQNGVVYFPGSSSVYVNGTIEGGFGVSGDGVNQDDFITNGGIQGFAPPANLQADNYIVRGVRLAYFVFPRNPTTT